MNESSQYGSPSAVTDEQLMSEFARGSSDAFAELFQRYRQPMFGFFRRRLADVSCAEELAQEVFVVLLRSADRYVLRLHFAPISTRSRCESCAGIAARRYSGRCFMG